MARQRKVANTEGGRDRLRQPSGAGHVKKRLLTNGEERWDYDRDFGRGPDGRRIRRRFTGRTLAEAMELAEKFGKSLANGGPLSRDRTTVGEYLSRWLADNPGRCRETTLLGYGQKVRIYLVPRIGGIQLAKLHRAHIVHMYGTMEKEGVGDRTIQYTHAVLRKALNDAVAHYGLLDQNPSEKIKVATPEPQERQVVPPERIGEVIEAMRDDWLFPYYYLSLLTGARRGELCGLRWSDVDLTATVPCLHIRRSMAQMRKNERGIGGRQLTKTKTDMSRRTVTLTPEAATMLVEHRKAQALLRQVRGASWNQENMVFTSPTGEPLSPSTASQHWARIRAGLGLPNVRLHDLRHSHATLLLQLGVNMKVVQKRLGHKNISITMDIYSHVTDSMEIDMLQKLRTATPATATHSSR